MKRIRKIYRIKLEAVQLIVPKVCEQCEKDLPSGTKCYLLTYEGANVKQYVCGAECLQKYNLRKDNSKVN